MSLEGSPGRKMVTGPLLEVGRAWLQSSQRSPTTALRVREGGLGMCMCDCVLPTPPTAPCPPPQLTSLSPIGDPHARYQPLGAGFMGVWKGKGAAVQVAWPKRAGLREAKGAEVGQTGQ